MKRVTITVGEEKFEGVLDEELAPQTVSAIADALPLAGKGKTWGDEIYFTIPVDVDLENGRETVSVGELDYWPQGNAFCIFYGKTPMSPSTEKIVPASTVNPVGRIENPEGLKQHAEGEMVRVEMSNVQADQ